MIQETKPKSLIRATTIFVNHKLEISDHPSPSVIRKQDAMTVSGMQEFSYTG